MAIVAPKIEFFNIFVPLFLEKNEINKIKIDINTIP